MPPQLPIALSGRRSQAGGATEAIARGCHWLVEATAEGTSFKPSPIGLYFAKLWYWERLYPIIFTVGALERRRP